MCTRVGVLFVYFFMSLCSKGAKRVFIQCAPQKVIRKNFFIRKNVNSDRTDE